MCGEWGIAIADMDYEAEIWQEKIRGLEKEPEDGDRCIQCFKMRLEKTAKYAGENDYDVFGTTLTSGRNKKADVINPLGEKAAEKFDLEFYSEDWKKGGRQEKTSQIIKEKNIYRQDYCGCVYSIYDKNNKK